MSDPVIYTGVLPIGNPRPCSCPGCSPVNEPVAGHDVAGGHWAAIATRAGAALVPRATRVAQLAVDNQLSSSTAYRYLHEGIDVLAAAAPGLHGALLAARAAGHTHVQLDGTLIGTDPVLGRRSERRGDLWWSGKHHARGGNVQVVTAPDGWPLWTSPVRPGREHDTTCARTHPGAARCPRDLDRPGPRGARRARLPGRTGPVDLSVQHPGRWRAQREPARSQRPALGHPSDRRARQLAAQDHLQGAAPGQLLPLAHRRAITAAALVLFHVENDSTT